MMISINIHAQPYNPQNVKVWDVKRHDDKSYSHTSVDMGDGVTIFTPSPALGKKLGEVLQECFDYREKDEQKIGT
jgi:hypothetical protein